MNSNVYIFENVNSNKTAISLWFTSEKVNLILILFQQVRYLKIIEKSGYQALPWVRYITQNGDYQLRTQ